MGSHMRKTSARERMPWLTWLLALACVAAVALLGGVGKLIADRSAAEEQARIEAQLAEEEAARAEAEAEAARQREAEILALEAKPDPVTVDIMMVGDMLIHLGVYQSGIRDDGTLSYEHLFAPIQADIDAADIAIVNQETMLGGMELGFSGYPEFNSPHEIGAAEANAGFDVVLSATNHAMDKRMAGISSALGFWRANYPDMNVLGIAETKEEYDRVCIIDKDGFKVAVLNYTYGTNDIPLPEDNPYAVTLLDEGKIRADVAAAREQGADAIVACPHWGTEYEYVPDDDQRWWADLFLELGVDVVIGSHPHVIEPVEVLEREDGRSMVVFWSLGNFVSTQAEAPNMVGGMAKCRLVKDADGVHVESYGLWPTVTHRAPGTSFAAYKLCDYTEELAGANEIRSLDGRFTREWCVGFCREVLGEGFDESSCSLEATLAATPAEELPAAA